MPEVQESFTMSYQTSTSTNGHHGDGDASSTNSQTLVPVDNASLISRSTSQTKTQQVCNYIMYLKKVVSSYLFYFNFTLFSLVFLQEK